MDMKSRPNMNERMMKKLLMGGAGVIALLMLGCTGGSSNTNNDGIPDHRALASGSYQLVFSVDASAAPSPVTGLELTVQLPKGVTVATDADGKILASALSVGGAVKGTNLITGRYVASKQQAVLSLSAAATTSWTGEFAKLNLAIPDGVNLSEYSFATTAQSNFLAYKVVGLSSTREMVPLTDMAKTTVSLKKL